MKIEKVNDNQIRCTLTRDDLVNRQIKLSELAYGTDKAKALFRDMMQQAAYEFGFEAEDIPLMIEAIPLSSDCIILIITKVEYPEELDTRFSKFAPSAYDEDPELAGQAATFSEGADDVLDLFKKLKEEKASASHKKGEGFVPLQDTIGTVDTTQQKTQEHSRVSLNLTKLYTFSSLDEVTRLATVLRDFYAGKNSLFKDTCGSAYFLLLNKNDHTPEEFNKVCNIASEYANQEKYTTATGAYLVEHYQPVIADNALQVLGVL